MGGCVCVRGGGVYVRGVCEVRGVCVYVCEMGVCVCEVCVR